MHQCRHQHGAQDEGVHQDGAPQANAELGDDALSAEGEGREDADHDERGGRDDPPGVGLAPVDRLGVAPGVQPLLVHARDEEHLVVHREAEEYCDHDHRKERLDRSGARADQRAAPAPLKDRDHEPEGRTGREQVHRRGGEWNDDAAEGDHQQEAPEQHDDANEERDLREEDRGEVGEDCRDAADENSGVARRGGGGDVGVADRVDQVLGLRVLGAGLWHDIDHGDPAVRAQLQRRDRGDVGLALERLLQGSHRRSVAGVVDRAHDLKGAVEPGAEAGSEQVVGLSGGGVGRVRAMVGAAQVQREEGYGHQYNDDECGQREDSRPTSYEVGPTLPVGRDDDRLGAVGLERAPLFATEGVVLLEAEQGGQECQGRKHRDQHRERGGDGDAVEEREPQDQHAEQRDTHGNAGEEHGPSGGVDCRDNRVLDAHSTLQTLAAARDDEERVINTDAQSNERAENRRELGDVEPVAQQRRRGRGDAQREQRDAERQQHGEERPEGEHEDDRGGDEPEDLARASFGRVELPEGVAAELDVE